MKARAAADVRRRPRTATASCSIALLCFCSGLLLGALPRVPGSVVTHAALPFAARAEQKGLGTSGVLGSASAALPARRAARALPAARRASRTLKADNDTAASPPAPTRAVMLAFGCPQSFAGVDADVVYEECHHRLVHFEQSAAGAIACLRQHWDGAILMAYPTPRFNRTLDNVTNYLFDPRLLSSGIATQIVAMQSSTFDETLWLDSDTCVMSDRFSAFFAPLQFYDFASVWECCAVGPRPTPAVGDGWEPQCGIFAVRRSARQLLVDWEMEFGDGSRYPYSSVNQNALAKVFQKSNFRFYPMQAQFNWRVWTVSLIDSSHIVGPVGSRDPVIRHDHGLDGFRGVDRHVHALAGKNRIMCDICKDTKDICGTCH